MALLSACAPKQPEATIETETVKQADINTSITATGTIEPVTKVEVGTQVSGIIDRLYVDYNSEVRKGQLIAELDRTNLQARLSSAQAQLASAKSDYEYQKLNLSRMQRLYEKKYISDDEYESARLQFVKSESTYKAQQLAVNEAKTNLGYAYIYSPIDGVILSREVEEGQTVAAAMTTPTLFTIAQDLTNMRVIADVDEADIGQVRTGQRVTFTVDAFPNDEFSGAVTQVRRSATTTSNVVTYEVVISAPNPDLKLMPGLTANVTIFTLEMKNVIAVSNKALHFTPNQLILGDRYTIQDCSGHQKVWIREGDILRAIPVKTGESNGVLTKITDGLKAGAEVVCDVTANTPAIPDAGSQQGKNPFMPGPPGKKK